jgi:hypothetical protein
MAKAASSALPCVRWTRKPLPATAVAEAGSPSRAHWRLAGGSGIAASGICPRFAHMHALTPMHEHMLVPMHTLMHVR